MKFSTQLSCCCHVPVQKVLFNKLQFISKNICDFLISLFCRHFMADPYPDFFIMKNNPKAWCTCGFLLLFLYTCIQTSSHSVSNFHKIKTRLLLQ